jgi:2-dehydro-3-deoxy-D-gluconate 5-dehydrogenase
LRVAAITGGAGGLGAAIAVGLANSGHDILLYDVAAASSLAEEVVERVRACGGRALFVPLDVTDLALIPAAIELGAAELAPPTVWVNNAGVIVRRPALDVAPDEWKRVIDVCLTGAFFCAQAFARLALAGEGGCIINIASIFGLVGGPNRVAYSAAKAGLVNLTRVLAYEWHPTIRVNAVAPTFADTPMTAAAIAAGLDVLNRSFDERLARAEDVANAVCFLASDNAEMITGHTLPVDGGWLTW